MSISQNGFPPFTMTCFRCGAVWDPQPPKGQKEVTDNRLETETRRHFKECPGGKVAKGEPGTDG